MSDDRPRSLVRTALPAVVLGVGSMALLLQLDHPAALAEGDLAVDVASAVTPATVPAATAPAATSPSTAPVTTVPPVPERRADGRSILAPEAGVAAPPVTEPSAPVTEPAAPVTTAPAATAPPVAAAGGACTGTAYDGPVVDTRWGPVQVQATVGPDGTICTVDAPVTPSDHRKSVSINDRAVPVLNQRAVDAQGTGFSGVTGATVTTNAYKASLQAILDQVA